MTNGEFQGYLTEDETHAIEIINGLEWQASESVKKIDDAKKSGIGFEVGAAASVVLFFMDKTPDPLSIEKATWMTLAASLTIGGLTQFAREWRLRADYARKASKADVIRQELDPADVGLFDDHLYYSE